MSRGSLKSFLPLMYPKPLYLELLHFHPSEETLRTLERCVLRSRSYQEDLEFLLSHSNWRFQLLGCSALSAVQPTPTMIGPVWAAFDRGSWISPQLVATACCCDPDFIAHASDRISRATIVLADREPVTPPATTPGAPALKLEPKAFFALAGLLLHEPGDDSRVDERIAEFRIQAVWAEDRASDDGERIATSWLGLVREARLR